MRQMRLLFLALIVLVFSSAAGNAGSANGDSIEISALDGSYELTVPVSRLVMTIPKGELSQRKNSGAGATGGRRYFYFEDKALGLIISGWFEPERAFSGIRKFWEAETTAWRRRGLPEPRDVSFVKIDHWDSIIYDMPLPAGSNSHIRAHWLQAGTWIDVHLSITSDRPNPGLRARLQSLLKSIQIREKRL